MIKNLKKNKACPEKLQRSGGFVILFAVTLSAILLSIALGVSNITLKELKFGTSAKDTNDAFFAADTGAECAFYNDKSTSTIFVQSPTAYTIQCAGNTVWITQEQPSLPIWDFVVYGLGSGGQGCAKVKVDKTPQTPPSAINTTITSDGYNNGSNGPTCSPTSNTVQREIQSSY